MSTEPSTVQPLLILLIFPALVGVCAELIFRDAKNASLAAAIGSIVVTCLAVQGLAAPGAWNWLAALLLSLLPISIAVCTALFCYGRAPTPRRRLQ
ncbi:MAG: hypothetical protein ABI190_09530 [Casimicrobiaceae bacterium]